MVVLLLVMVVLTTFLLVEGLNTLPDLGALLLPPRWLLWLAVLALLTWCSGEK